MYTLLQIKKQSKHLPAILFTTVILTSLILLSAFLIFSLNRNSENRQKVNIAIAGDAKDSYLGIGIGILENMDSSRFAVNFIKMDMETAEKKLENGDVSAILEIPEDFLTALGEGRHIPLTLITLKGFNSLSNEIIREITDVVSVTIINSEYAVYAMQQYLYDKELIENLSKNTDNLNILLLSNVLKRNTIYRTENYGAYKSDSIILYYASAMLILFLLLWGINGGILLHKNDFSLHKLLYAKGVSSFNQVLGEYLAYVLMFIVGLVIPFVLATVLIYQFNIDLVSHGIKADIVRIFSGMLPIALLICAFHFLIFEAINSTVSSIMISTVLSFFSAYISGLFYPTSFFPDTLSAMGNHSPIGIAFSYLREIMRGENGSILYVYLYTVVFILISVFIRQKRLEKS